MMVVVMNLALRLGGISRVCRIRGGAGAAAVLVPVAVLVPAAGAVAEVADVADGFASSPSCVSMACRSAEKDCMKLDTLLAGDRAGVGDAVAGWAHGGRSARIRARRGLRDLVLPPVGEFATLPIDMPAVSKTGDGGASGVPTLDDAVPRDAGAQLSRRSFCRAGRIARQLWQASGCDVARLARNKEDILLCSTSCATLTPMTKTVTLRKLTSRSPAASAKWRAVRNSSSPATVCRSRACRP